MMSSKEKKQLELERHIISCPATATLIGDDINKFSREDYLAIAELAKYIISQGYNK